MKILVIAAHPRLNRSRANQALLRELNGRANVEVRDLYREYPDWNIDADFERSQLLRYDRIVFQFPFYWYSCPPLLKKWFDDVLIYGWAFGPGGEHLRGKEFMLATTAGGTEGSYRSGGGNGFTVDELLRPIQRTIERCNGSYLPAFASFNADQATDEQLALEGRRYGKQVLAPARILVD